MTNTGSIRIPTVTGEQVPSKTYLICMMRTTSTRPNAISPRLPQSALEFIEPPYSLDTLKQIHRTLFSAIYSWAGEIRTVKISKGGNQFCVPDRIEPEAAREFRKVESNGWFEGYSRDLLLKAVAESYSTLNVAHPFREGNGRAQRMLFEWIIINAGYEINWWKVDKQEWIKANHQSFHGDDGPLIQIFDRCIGLPIMEDNADDA